MSKKKETKLNKYMKVPIKMVVKARDLYIRSMNQLSSHDLLGGGMGFGVPVVCHASHLPRSHSQNSMRDKEHRVAELVRAASASDMTVNTRRGPSKLLKAKSCGAHHGFETIYETSPLITVGSNHKMIQRSKY